MQQMANVTQLEDPLTTWGPWSSTEFLPGASPFLLNGTDTINVGLCISEPDCTDDNDAWELTEKYGYVTRSTDDITAFLKDYSTGKLVNKTEQKTQGNFCYTPTNCVNITEEAKEARALFDKYW